MAEEFKTMVRVERVQRLTVTEFVDVPIYHDEDDFGTKFDRETKAKNLIEAMISAGHEIDWRHVSEEADKYVTRITAESASAPVRG